MYKLRNTSYRFITVRKRVVNVVLTSIGNLPLWLLWRFSHFSNLSLEYLKRRGERNSSTKGIKGRAYTHIQKRASVYNEIIPEPSVRNDQSGSLRQWDGSAGVSLLGPEVVRFTPGFAVTGQLDPQNGIFCRIQNGAVHLDGAANFGGNRGCDVGNGGSALALDHWGQKAND